MTAPTVNPYQPAVDQLSNGVTLINAPSASRNVGIFLIVRAGSRDETPQTSGLAHFLEHMFFKGTVNRPSAQQISREVDRLGASNNAYTDTEEVAYYAEGPAAALEPLTDILCDMLTHPLFQAEEVERERNVVIQELSARLADPEGWMWDRLGTVAFGGDQPMSWSAAGSPRVIEQVSRDALVEYHRDFYAPQEMALVVSGGASVTVAHAEALLGGIPPAVSHTRVAARWGVGERYVSSIRQATEDEEPQVKMVIATPGVATLDSDRTALSVFSHILGGGMSSRLFHSVRERNGLCYSIHAFHEGYDDTGLFAITTATRPKDAVRAIELSFAEFRRMAEEPVPEDELSAGKSAMIGRLLRSTETAMAGARYYGGRWRARLPLETPDARAEAIAAVTAGDIQRVAGRLVAGIGEARLAFVGPTDQGEDLLAATDL